MHAFLLFSLISFLFKACAENLEKLENKCITYNEDRFGSAVQISLILTPLPFFRLLDALTKPCSVDADIAAKQGHEDVSALSPTAIAIEVYHSDLIFTFFTGKFRSFKMFKPYEH